MAYTVPPTNPRSVPHLSCTYCETALVGSNAKAAFTRQMLAIPARRQPRSRRPGIIRSRKVFELLNHNLSWMLRTVLGMMEFIQLNMDGLRRGRRNAGGKNMFANTFRSGAHYWTADCLERRNTRLPTKCVSKHAHRRQEARDIFRNVVRLHNILRILAAEISPAAQFYVQFASDFVRLPFIQGKYSQHCGRLQMSAILHNESVSAISQTAV